MRKIKSCLCSGLVMAIGQGAAAAAPLPASVTDALDEALADERKALATYEAVMARFGEVRPFVNIAQAEQRHIAALTALYEAYGLSLPEPDIDVPDEVETSTLEEICALGVQAEIENAALYDDKLLPAVADYPDITVVMKRLRDASINNHKPAFERCGGRGEGRGQGHGKGRSQGRRMGQGQSGY